jgi:hypothetical protein
MNTTARPHSLNRRHFISHSVLATATVGAAAHAADPGSGPASGNRPAVAANSKGQLPAGKIGKLTVSRLISGGNLISGWAHSRDLQYMPALMRAYNTEEKVLDTLQIMEEHGINTIIADPRKKPMDVFARYWKERGGKMQWIAEGHPGTDDWQTDIKRSIDFGAAAVYVQGVIGDRWYKEQRLDLLGKCVEFVKANGVTAGVGAHKLEVIMESEQRKFGAEFYMKTLHHTKYWSSRQPGQDLDVIDNRTDNYWDLSPEKTIAFMQSVEKPWIAFKTLAAGAIRPESGFKYAFENGADFLCVGMFDFQVAEDASLVRQFVRDTQNRDRAWCG